MPGTRRHSVTHTAGSEEGLSGDARPHVDPGSFPGAREVCTHVRVSHAPGKVPGTCLAMCMSLVFCLHQLYPQPLKTEKGGWEPRVRGLQTHRRGPAGFLACSVLHPGKG